MSPQYVANGPSVQLTPEQYRRLASLPSVKIEGLSLTQENREFFASRGLDLDSLNLGGGAGDIPEQRQPEDFRRPRYTPLQSTGQIRILAIEPGKENEPLRCGLLHRQLQKRNSYDPSLSSYDALSYIWNSPIRTRHYTSTPPDPCQEFSPESWLASAMNGSSYTATDGTPPVSSKEQPDQIDERQLMRPVEITIDRETCDINANLASALRHLRMTTSARNLWVDALCIDQQNLQERGEQLSQMDKIYQSADTVQIWLGPAADGSDDAMPLAESIWQYKFLFGCDPMEIFKHGDMNARIHVLNRLEKLTILLSRPWFTRRWVVQELALARKAVVHCGGRTVDWAMIAYTVEFLQKRRLELTYMRIRDLYLRADPITYRRGYLKTLAAETMVKVSQAVVRRLPSPCTHTRFDWRADLETLLSSLHTLQCSNPLDTIYALLAIASDASSLDIGPPDYAKPVEEVYTNVVLRIIETKHSLNILCQRWASAVHSSIKLPFWIQSYSPSATQHEGGTDAPQQRQRFVGDGRGSRFRAAGPRAKKGKPGEMKDYEGIGRKLMVTGVIVDVVEHVGEGAFQDVPGSWRDMALDIGHPLPEASQEKIWRAKDAFRILPSTQPKAVHKSQTEYWDSFADLVTASSSKQDSYANKTYGPISQALFADQSPYRKDNNGNINIFEVRAEPTPHALYSPSDPTVLLPEEDVHAFLSTIASTTLNRALARTFNGRYALVDALVPCAEAGDVVCVLVGYDVPVLLRPKMKLDFASTMSHGIFEWVGECYVQGIMFGEAITRAEGLVAGEEGRQYVGGIFLDWGIGRIRILCGDGAENGWKSRNLHTPHLFSLTDQNYPQSLNPTPHPYSCPSRSPPPRPRPCRSRNRSPRAPWPPPSP